MNETIKNENKNSVDVENHLTKIQADCDDCTKNAKVILENPGTVRYHECGFCGHVFSGTSCNCFLSDEAFTAFSKKWDCLTCGFRLEMGKTPLETAEACFLNNNCIMQEDIIKPTIKKFKDLKEAVEKGDLYQANKLFLTPCFLCRPEFQCFWDQEISAHEEIKNPCPCYPDLCGRDGSTYSEFGYYFTLLFEGEERQKDEVIDSLEEIISSLEELMTS